MAFERARLAWRGPPNGVRFAMVDSVGLDQMLNRVAASAREAGVFAAVEVDNAMVSCAAKESAEPAQYRIRIENDQIWAELVTLDRWLSGSIEGDLVHSGDKLHDLIDEELADLGWEGAPSSFEHFRDDQMLYVFRSRVPVSPSDEGAATAATQWLLAYELTFRELGDMTESDDD